MRPWLIGIASIVLAAGTVWEGVSAQSPSNKPTLPLLFTAAAQYDTEAWLRGGERFPAGAQVLVLENGKSSSLVAGFAATADPVVSFDGTKVLFAGKREPHDPWQIWEVAVGGSNAKRITAGGTDCIRPLYLPGDRVVYARKVDGRFTLETVSHDGGAALQLTYSPGNALPTDVLRDGRILFEAAFPLGKGQSPEIYTVYSDGSGVEAYRCDHGARREGGKQAASGDVVFATEHGVGRFTSPLAHGVAMKASPGEYAGDVAEVASGEYLVAWRSDEKGRYSLQKWNANTGAVETVLAASTTDFVQPMLVTSRPVPNHHPSGLHDWNYANLLCLNAYASKYDFSPGTIASIRLYTTNEKGKPKLLGSSNVEADGSFYVQVPADRPLQIELLDWQGKTLRREQGWWWMRKGEQRVCVGCHSGPERAPENAVPAVLVKSTTPVNLTGTATLSQKEGR